MLRALVAKNDRLWQADEGRSVAFASDATWVDLLSPTKEEIETVEKTLRVNLPTREEMREIEASSWA